MRKQNIILLILVAFLAFFPLYLNNKADFAGADERASEMISEINPVYQPWFQELWKPPSAEVESFLFALQASLGAGFVGYFFGYLKGKKSQSNVKGKKN